MATALTATLRADITQFERAIQQAETKITGLQRSTTQVNRELAKFGNDFGGATLIRQANSMAKAVEDIGGVTKLTAAEQKRLAGTVDEALSKYRALGQEVPPALVKVSAALDRIRDAEEQAQRGAEALRDAQKRAASEQAKALQEAARAQQQLAQNLNTIGGGLTRAGAVLTATVTAPIVAGFALSIKSAKDFESAFANVVKTVDGLDVDNFGKLNTEAQKLRGEIRNLAKEIPVAATELSSIAAIGGQFGVSRDSLVKFTETVAKLGVAVDRISAEEAAAAIAQISKVAGLAEGDFERLASAIVDLGNSGNSTEADILDLSKRFAGAGAAAGLSAAEIAGVSAAIANVGINAEAGGSAISKTFNEIGAAVARGGKDLEAFAKIAGVSSEQFAKIFRSDAVKAIDLFIGGLRRARDAGQDLTLILDSVDIKEVRQSDTLRRLAGDYQNFSKTIDQSREAFERNTALTEEARKKFATFDNQLQLFQNRINDIGIELGGPMLEGLRGLLEASDPLIDATADAARKFAALSDEGKLATVVLVGAVGIAPAMLLVAGQTLQAASSLIEFGRALKGLQAAQAATAIQGIGTASTSTAASLVGTAGLVGGLLAATVAALEFADSMEHRVAASLDKVGGKASEIGKLVDQFNLLQNLAKGSPLAFAADVGGTLLKGAFSGDSAKAALEAEKKAVDDLADAYNKEFQAQGRREASVVSAAESGAAATKRLAVAVGASSEAAKQAAAEAKKLAAELDKITGRDKIKAADDLAKSLSKLSFRDIDPTKLKDVHKTLTEAIKAAERLGDEVPGSWRLIEQATRPAIQSTRLFVDQLTLAQPAVKSLGLEIKTAFDTQAILAGLMNVKGGMEAINAASIGAIEKQKELAQAGEQWRNGIANIAQAFDHLASSGGLDGTLQKIAQIVQLMNVGAQAGAALNGLFKSGTFTRADGTTFQGAFSGFRNSSGNFTAGSVAGGSAQAFGAGVTAVGALDSATNVKGRGNRALRGAATGAAIGGQIAGPYGALAGLAIGALVGAFRNPAFEDVYKRVAKNFGVELSDETAKAIANIAKTTFKGDRAAAEIFSLDKIIAEGGGLKQGNFDVLTQRLRDAFSMKDVGKFSADQLTDVLKQNFGSFAAYVEQSTDLIGHKFSEIARLAKSAGLDIPEIKQFVGGQTGRVGSSLEALSNPLTQHLERLRGAQSELPGLIGQRDQLRGDGDLSDAETQQLAALEEQIRKTQSAIDDNGTALQGAQAEFDRLGIIAVGAFNAARSSGLGFLEATDQLGPGLDRLIGLQQELGLQGGEAFNELAKFRDLVGQNEPLVASAEGLGEALLGISNIGGLTAETLAALEGQGLQTFDRLTAAGFSSNQAIEIMRGFIDNLRDAHMQLGIPIDANTQALIDQAAALEGLGPKSPTEAMTAGFEKVVTAVNRLAKGLGIDVPEAAEEAAKATEAAASRSSSAAADAAQVIAKKGGEAFIEFERKASEAQDGVSDALRDAAERGTAYYGEFAIDAGRSSSEASEELERFWHKYYNDQEQALSESDGNLKGFVESANEALAKIERTIEIEFQYRQTGDVPSGPPPGGGDVPGLATGGIVRARPGGTIVRIGEGGRDEAVIPLPNRPGQAVTVPMLVAALSQIQFTGTLEGRPVLRYVSREIGDYIQTRTGQRVPI